MPILWGKKRLPAVQTCPSCQSTKVVETERTETEVLFQCTNCWWPFVLRKDLTRH